MSVEYIMTGATIDECASLVMKYHYSKRMPANIQQCFGWREKGGLFGDGGELQAAIIYSMPVNRNYNQSIYELIRLVRKEDFKMPLSSFVSWSLRWLRANTKVPYVISYADSGEGHHGGIYQACSFDFVAKKESGHIGYRNKEGVFLHGRSCNARYGTRAVSRIAEIAPHLIPVFGEPKYLYVKNIRMKRKRMLEELNCIALPYPKPNKEKHNVS